MTDTLTIGQVAKRTSVASSTLRYYESIGLMPAPKRVSGQRRYDPSVIQRLKVLQLAQKAGFSIVEMQTLVHGFQPETPPAARWRILATTKLAELELQAQQLEKMKQILETALLCGCLRLEDCTISLETDKCNG